MPTTGESEEVNEEERILELKREKRSRKTVVTKTRHNLERLNASGEDSESIENEIETLWKVLDICLTVMEELQRVYLRLGYSGNKLEGGRRRSRGFGEGGKQCNWIRGTGNNGHLGEKNMQMQQKRHCCRRPCRSHLLSKYSN